MQQSEYRIQKPAGLKGYPLHRLVAELAQGRKVQFSDQGSHLQIRTDASINAPQVEMRAVEEGAVIAFELTACVSSKCRGKHKYPAAWDWRTRHSWLERKAAQYGFALLALHCEAGHLHIDDGSRDFKLDQTKFTGVLKVTNLAQFRTALKEGVGNTGRAFGLGMLII